MGVEQGVLFGVVALIGWGVADFLAKKAVDKVGDFNALFFSQLLTTALLAAITVAVGGFVVPAWDLAPLLFVAAMLSGFPYLAFYKGMRKGSLSVVAPIAGAWGAGSAVVATLLFAESLTLFQWGSVAAIAAGMVLVSTSWRELSKLSYKKLAGVEWAAFAFVGWSVSAVLLKPLIAALGVFSSILFIKMVSLPALLAAAPLMGYKAAVPKGVWLILAGIAVLDLAAFLGLNFGIQSGQVSIVGPVAAAFPAVTVVLAALFLKEKLEASQKIGVLLAVAGMVALALA
jgi:drug/metabolite transporter (DMT)-like permease